MKKYIILLSYLILVGLTAKAQTSGQDLPGSVLIYPSQNGNLIKVWAGASGIAEFSNVLKNTDHFEVRRAIVVRGEKEFTLIGKTNRITKPNALKEAIGAEGYEDFKRLKGIKTDEALEGFLQTEYNIDSIGVFTETDAKFAQIFGIAYMDTEAKKDSLYMYKVMRIDKLGKEELWAANMVVSRVPNPLLSKITMQADTIITNDTLALYKYKINFPEYVPPTAPPTFEEFGGNQAEADYFKLYNAYLQKAIPSLNAKPVNNTNTNFRAYYKLNDEATWRFYDRLRVQEDSLGANRLNVLIKTKPEDKVSLVLLPEDYGKALGDSSQISSVFALSASTVPLIYSITGSDSTNCTKITWDKLPNKPYYTGILVERSHSENKPVRLATLAPESNTYKDFDIEPGMTYTYYVRPLFTPKQNISQQVPASASLSGNKFAAPLPPYNLVIDSSSHIMPTLRWEAIESKSRFGFIVYRGISKETLLPLDLVKNTHYTDSSGVFSGKLTYYYAVVEQNLTQDTSVYSNIASYRPNMAIEVISPPYLNSTLINNELLLEWNDMRERDEYIIGYTIRRKKEGESNFTDLNTEIISNSYFTDTTFVKGVKYEYQIASVSITNTTAAYSPAIEIEYEKDLPEPISSFKLQNKTTGILITWGGIQMDNIKAYNVYKIEPNKTEWQKISTVQGDTFQYLDTNNQAEESYIYAISCIDKDDRESLRSSKKSIKRVIPKTF